jgi:signal peptidase I
MRAVAHLPTGTIDPPRHDADARRRRRRRSRIRALASWGIFIVVVLLASTAVRAYALQTYYVPTPSMSPTLVPGDRIIVDKLSSTIRRGDIVVFRDVPGDKGGPPTLVKRVIGLPGERISSVGDTVYINGKPLKEPWLPSLTGDCYESAALIKAMTIPPKRYFMMGDCRGDSGDSRFFGTVPLGNVVGKVDLVIWRNGHPWFHWF